MDVIVKCSLSMDKINKWITWIKLNINIVKHRVTVFEKSLKEDVAESISVTVVKHSQILLLVDLQYVLGDG